MNVFTSIHYPKTDRQLEALRKGIKKMRKSFPEIKVTVKEIDVTEHRDSFGDEFLNTTPRCVVFTITLTSEAEINSEPNLLYDICHWQATITNTTNCVRPTVRLDINRPHCVVSVVDLDKLTDQYMDDLSAFLKGTGFPGYTTLNKNHHVVIYTYCEDPDQMSTLQEHFTSHAADSFLISHFSY